MNPIADMLKQYAGAVIAIVVLIFSVSFAGAYWWHGMKRYEAGKAEVQAAFDKYKQDEKTAQDQYDKQQELTNEYLQADYNRAIENAKTKAGRDAIAGYLANAGMLPTGGALCGQQSGSDRQTISASIADGVASKSGACQSGAGIGDFAIRCYNDAVKLMAWQDKARREGWPVK